MIEKLKEILPLRIYMAITEAEKDGLIEIGNFYTLEPGFYKGFGIRLENDYLLTDSELENLFEDLMPLDIKEYILKWKTLSAGRTRYF